MIPITKIALKQEFTGDRQTNQIKQTRSMQQDLLIIVLSCLVLLCLIRAART